MKVNRLLISSLLAATTLGMVSSCKKEEFKPNTENTVKSVKMNIQVAPLVVNGINLPVANTEIKIVNKTNSSEYTTTTDSAGLATFADLTPGTYTINAALTINAATYNTLSGDNVTEDLSFNQVSSDVMISTDTTLNMELVAGKVGDWVIKQIYYAGSDVTNGATFRDAFIEIYNNSNQVMYADSLIIAEVYGKLNNTAANNLTANGQYDWSRSIGNNVSNANEDYIYSSGMYMIPSNATRTLHPVEPGKSLIIASTAINHKAPYTNNNNIAVSVLDPSLTVDLSQADFEVNAYPYKLAIDPNASPFASDLDNPNVADLKVLHMTTVTDLVFDALGRESYVIVEPSATFNYSNLVKVPLPTVDEVTSTTATYVRIPVANVLDAVELQHPVSASRVPRRLPTKLDAGAYFVPNGQYSSQSAVRKTKRITDDGRRILQDTNNSGQDFGYLNRADASKSSTSFL